ncbi:DUF6221 family protein [Micromonospora sp. NPDC053740]|uniref:DUF6221 family protein n=1 Tax=Micromonospora sp. NPDC053740 TaxID=3155173 RepID=UPI0034142D6F
MSEIAGLDKHQPKAGNGLSLVDWLRAQLDEDERVAQEAGVSGPQGSDLFVIDDDHQHNTIAISAARVLRRVAAARRALDLHNRDHECSVYDDHGEVDNCAWVLKGDTCSTVRLMFDEYSGQPGYRPEWGTQ